MNRFLLFVGYNYYPLPGFETFIDSFKTEEEAKSDAQKLLENSQKDWFQIVDIFKRTYKTIYKTIDQDDNFFGSF